MPLLEFTVPGPPVSHQSRNKAALALWKAAVRTEAARRWGANRPLMGKLKCTIVYFHEDDWPSLDDDNMVKPVRDALNGLVYEDDRQITYSETVQYPIEAPIMIRRGSAVLLAASSVGDAFVYVRIEDAPQVLQIPG